MNMLRFSDPLAKPLPGVSRMKMGHTHVETSSSNESLNDLMTMPLPNQKLTHMPNESPSAPLFSEAKYPAMNHMSHNVSSQKPLVRAHTAPDITSSSKLHQCKKYNLTRLRSILKKPQTESVHNLKNFLKAPNQQPTGNRKQVLGKPDREPSDLSRNNSKKSQHGPIDNLKNILKNPLQQAYRLLGSSMRKENDGLEFGPANHEYEHEYLHHVQRVEADLENVRYTSISHAARFQCCKNHETHLATDDAGSTISEVSTATSDSGSNLYPDCRPYSIMSSEASTTTVDSGSLSDDSKVAPAFAKTDEVNEELYSEHDPQHSTSSTPWATWKIEQDTSNDVQRNSGSGLLKASKNLGNTSTLMGDEEQKRVSKYSDYSDDRSSSDELTAVGVHHHNHHHGHTKVQEQAVVANDEGYSSDEPDRPSHSDANVCLHPNHQSSQDDISESDKDLERVRSSWTEEAKIAQWNRIMQARKKKETTIAANEKARLMEQFVRLQREYALACLESRVPLPTALVSAH